MAVVLALLSSLSWGTADFFGGLMSRKRSVYAVVGASQAASFVVVTAIFLVRGQWGAPGSWLTWGVLAGIAGVSGLLVFYRALAIGTMGVVAPIAALGAVVPVAAGLVIGERPSVVAWVGGALALAGAILASGPELRGRAGLAPVVLAALAGAFFGCTLLFMAFGAESDSLNTLWAMRVASFVLFGAAAVATRSLGGVQVRDLPALVAIGLADGLANLLFALATTMGLLSLVTVLGSLYPVVTVALAAVVLGERLQRIQYVGVVGALAGVALISWGGAV